MILLLLVLVLLVGEKRSLGAAAWSHEPTSRRRWFGSTVSSLGTLILPSSSVFADVTTNANEFPLFVKPLTKLAPLGSPQSGSEKATNLSLNEIAARLSHDLEMGSNNQGGYFLTGDLSTELFRDDCTFVDPTNRVSSLSQYQNALRVLFDPSQSYVQIIEPLVVDEDKKTITGTIRSRGVLKFPWQPQISSYESTITYSVGEDGLVSQQSQTWSKSSSQALRESFTPGLFVPPPKSTLPLPKNEPLEVTKLFDYINGRRPNGYSQSERFEIAQLIEAIVAKRYPWERDMLPGKWMLAYLQPGPEGGGIDRRIPFPDFEFNDNFQIFSLESVTNVGELFGPLLKVKVSGSLEEDDRNSFTTPKRFVAHISNGELCWKEATCLPLPISGEGLFDGVYLGERLRIGQNLNGGGARVVQVRLDAQL